MSEQEQLNITEENKLSISMQDNYNKIILVKYPDDTMEIAIEDLDEQKTFDLSKAQKEYLIKWLQGERTT